MKSRDGRTKAPSKAQYGWLLYAMPHAGAALAGAVLLAGCSRAPSFSILGSFFPAWLVCIVAGMMLAAAIYRVFVYFKLDTEIVWSIAVYPCIALFFACVLWLIFFS